jgi:Carbohydrate-selective porin, OprB family/S-layer homology domain
MSGKVKKLFWQKSAKLWILTTIISVVASFTPALAQESRKSSANSDLIDRVESYTKEGQPAEIEQVTGVNQLKDVSPTDWSFEALQSLVERYGCIAGYPNSTYRGNRSLSRYEFAAGLNACLNQIERLVASSQSIGREDLDKIRRLSEEFQPELATLRGRVDGIEARTAELEQAQFSTTTKLEGQVIIGLGGIVTGDNADGEEVDRNTVLGHRTRLELNSSFTGKDNLFARISTGTFPEFSEQTGYFSGELGFAQPEDNNIALEVLQYGFPLGENTKILVSTAGGATDDIADTVNLFDGDGAEGSISNFGTRNPIYYPPGGAGLGITHELGDKFEVNALYLASSANDPTEGSGLFNGAYNAFGQILFKPNENLRIAANYTHGYNQSDTETGSSLANLQSLTEDRFGEIVPTSSNSYGVQASWKLSDRFVLGGWGGYSQITALSSLGGQLDRGTQDIFNWAVTLGFPDLGKEGNLAGIVVGMEPWVSESSIDTLGEDEDTSFHVEGFYQYKINDNIAITPGVVWVTSPNGNENNDDLVIGTIRTTFSF